MGHRGYIGLIITCLTSAYNISRAKPNSSKYSCYLDKGRVKRWCFIQHATCLTCLPWCFTGFFSIRVFPINNLVYINTKSISLDTYNPLINMKAHATLPGYTLTCCITLYCIISQQDKLLPHHACLLSLKYERKPLIPPWPANTQCVC